MSEQPRLRITWTVNAPTMIFGFAQAIALAWIVASAYFSMETQLKLIDQRVVSLEKRPSSEAQLIERVVRVEVSLDALNEQTRRVENKLDRVIEGGD